MTTYIHHVGLADELNDLPFYVINAALTPKKQESNSQMNQAVEDTNLYL